MTEQSKKLFNKSKSLYDPSRDTVGKIYRDAALNNTEDCIEIGDMSRELTTSLVDDLNDAFKNFDLRGKPYYLMIHESKDLQMNRAIRRRILYFGYRPWPEDDTVVFWRNPKKDILRFCWCLPHWAEMDNVLNNSHQYPEEYVFHIRSWKDYDLRPFGFYLHPEEKWIPNPKWRDRELEKPKTLIIAPG
jgi:hypothetical protein